MLRRDNYRQKLDFNNRSVRKVSISCLMILLLLTMNLFFVFNSAADGDDLPRDPNTKFVPRFQDDFSMNENSKNTIPVGNPEGGDTNPLPQLTIGAPTSVNESSSFNINVTANNNLISGVLVHLCNIYIDATNTTGQCTIQAPTVNENTTFTITAVFDGYLSCETTIVVMNTHHISDPLEVDFSYEIVDASGLNVSFFDQTTGGCGLYSYSWNFGDRFFSNDKDPIHNYTEPQNYDVTLFVYHCDYGGENITKTIHLDITADFSYTISGNTVTFIDQTTGPCDSYNWYWDFGDGNSSSERNPLYVYSSVGQYNVTLNVSQCYGLSNETYKTITIQNLSNPPNQDSVPDNTVPPTTPDVNSDVSPPTITMKYPTNNALIYERKPTIHISFSDLSGIDESLLILALDGDVVTEYSIISQTDTCYTPDTALSYSEHTIFFKVVDVHGNEKIEEWSFTIQQVILSEEETMGDIPAGEQANIFMNNSNETGIVGVILTPASNLTNVTVYIEYLYELPVEVTTPLPEDVIIYRVLDIKLLADGEYILEFDIEELWFEYKVLIEWITNNTQGNQTIRLMRYHNDTWEELNLTHICGIGDFYLHFKSSSPGCSTFAIVGSQVHEVKEHSSIPAIPWTIIYGIIGGSSITLIVVLFKAGYIYTNCDNAINKQKKKPKRSGILAVILTIFF